MTDISTPRPRAALFVTCMVDTLYPGVGMAAAQLLQRHGADVVFPDRQTCCGQPAFNAGYRNDARAVARHLIDVFWPLVDGGDVDAVVAPSGSCVAMVKRHYPILFEAAHDIEYQRRAVQLGEVTYELTQYLVDYLGVADAGARCPGRLAYHPCCHLLRELHIDAQPRRLLSSLKDAEIAELPNADECCGFGGLFALKNADISTAMGRRKVRNVNHSGADMVVLNDVSCMTHLNGILRREGHSCRAVHIAEVLNGTVEHATAERDSPDDR
ncbi:MAG: (Fe-S)-binding protein [Gemmatimonadota bacterium]|nr:MAG: (Fe-S)-binding protein [Gemmatimonadota bacterium]